MAVFQIIWKTARFSTHTTKKFSHTGDKFIHFPGSLENLKRPRSNFSARDPGRCAQRPVMSRTW